MCLLLLLLLIAKIKSIIVDTSPTRIEINNGLQLTYSTAEQSMKIIFLDVDGVLNHEHDSTGTMKPNLLSHLGDLVRKTSSKIVLSSTWRHHPELCQRITSAIVSVAKIPADTLVSMTGDSRPGNLGRAEEIAEWLNNYTTQSANTTPISTWVVLDTANLGGVPFFAGHFVHINEKVGLNKRTLKLAIKILNRQTTISTKTDLDQDVDNLMVQYQEHKNQILRDDLHLKIKALSERKEQLMDDITEGKLPWFDTGGDGAVLRLPMAVHIGVLDNHLRQLRGELNEVM